MMLRYLIGMVGLYGLVVSGIQAQKTTPKIVPNAGYEYAWKDATDHLFHMIDASGQESICIPKKQHIGGVAFEDKPISLRQCTAKCFALVDEATKEQALANNSSVAVRFWRLIADGKKGNWHIYYAEDEGFIAQLKLGNEVKIEWWEGRLPK